MHDLSINTENDQLYIWLLIRAAASYDTVACFLYSIEIVQVWGTDQTYQSFLLIIQFLTCKYVNFYWKVAWQEENRDSTKPDRTYEKYHFTYI